MSSQSEEIDVENLFEKMKSAIQFDTLTQGIEESDRNILLNILVDISLRTSTTSVSDIIDMFKDQIINDNNSMEIPAINDMINRSDFTAINENNIRCFCVMVQNSSNKKEIFEKLGNKQELFSDTFKIIYGKNYYDKTFGQSKTALQQNSRTVEFDMEQHRINLKMDPQKINLKMGPDMISKRTNVAPVAGGRKKDA
jgi:hypothetical protein